MELILYYGENQNITSEIITSSYSKKTIYYNNLKHSDNSVSLSIPYDSEIQNIINVYADDDIKAEIKEGTNYIFTGYIRKTFSFSKKQRNQNMSLEIVSPSFFLDIDSDSIYSKRGETLDEVIKYLLELTEIDCSYDVSDLKEIEVPLFILNEGDNIKETIDTILFEYGFQYDFDETGKFFIYSLFSDVPEDTSTITQTFDGTNSIEVIKISKKEQEYNGTKITYEPVSLKSDLTIFADTTDGDADDLTCNIELAAGEYLGDLDDGTTTYYIEYDSTEGDVKWAETASLSVVSSNNDGLITSFTNHGVQGELSIYNNSNSTITITQIKVTGSAYVSKETAISASTTGTKFYEYTSTYIEDSSTADELAANYTNWENYADYTMTIKSNTDYELGSFVKVEEVGLATMYGRIIEKTEKIGKPIQYKIEAISDYAASSATTKKRAKATFTTIGTKGEKGETGETGAAGVSMRNRGNWAADTDYVCDGSYIDIVFYEENGCSYMCNNSHTSSTNILPINTNYWTLIAVKGDTGETGAAGSQGTSLRNTGNWATDTEYVCDSNYIDIVYYTPNGCSYMCNISHVSSTTILPTNTDYWTLVASKGDTGEKGFTSTTIGFKVDYSAFSTANKGEVYVCGYDEETGELSDIPGYVTLDGTKYYAQGMLDSNAAMDGYMVISTAASTAAERPFYVFYNISGYWYSMDNDATTLTTTKIDTDNLSNYIAIAKIQSSYTEASVYVEEITPSLLSNVPTPVSFSSGGIAQYFINDCSSSKYLRMGIKQSDSTFSYNGYTTQYASKGTVIIRTNTTASIEPKMYIFTGTNWQLVDGVGTSFYESALSTVAALLPTIAGFYVSLGKDVPDLCGTYINTITSNSVFVDKLIANSAFISELSCNTAFIENLAAEYLFVSELTSNSAFIEELSCSSAFIEELFSNEIEVSNCIKSNNYSAGSTGFCLSSDGTADINELTIKNMTLNYDNYNSLGIGYQVLRNNTGSYNVAIGYQASLQNTTGSNNVAIGYYALNGNSTGSYNVAMGTLAGRLITSGGYNVAIGYAASWYLTTGNYNVAIGHTALQIASTGSHNIAIGYLSGRYITSSHNVVIGSRAGNYISSGTYNVFVNAEGISAGAEWKRQININDRLIYFEFGASATQATVYSALSLYLNSAVASNDYWLSGCIGQYRYDLAFIGRTSSTTISLYDNANSNVLKITSGSSTALGYPLKLFLVNTKHTPTNA